MELSSTRWRSLLSRTVFVILAVSLLVGATFTTGVTRAEAAPQSTFGTSAPSNLTRSDNDSSVEVGLRFTPTQDGTINTVRFYKVNSSAASTPSTVSLWSATGTRLATASVPATTNAGWITVALPSTVNLTANTEYIVSTFARNGSYVSTRNYFASAQTMGHITMPRNAGVFKYNVQSQFPDEVYQASNYWIDPVFAPTTGASKPVATPSATAKPVATPSATAKPVATPSATATATPTATATAAPTATATSGAPATGLMGWQLNAQNVGLAPLGLSCASLPRYTGSLTPAAGTRISGVRIVGQLDLRNGDIIVERSCIQPAAGASANNSTGALVSNFVCGRDSCPVISDKTVIIRDSEFDATGVPASQIAAACAFRGAGTLQRNYMHGMGSGICFYGTGMKHDAIAEQNYVTNLRSYGESHNEAATVRDFMLDENPNRVARFTNNRLDIAEGNVTAGLFIQSTGEDIDSLLVEGNLIEGGGYNLFLNQPSSGGKYSNVRATNNRFRSTGWGPSTVQGGPGWSVWSNNYRYDAARPNAQGALVAVG